MELYGLYSEANEKLMKCQCSSTSTLLSGHEINVMSCDQTITLYIYTKKQKAMTLATVL